jgi:hypothetical protein
MDTYTAGAAALAIFLGLGAVDGIYLHLWRYRLHARSASRYEHRIHTFAAVLFAATLPAVFLWETGGVLLWTGISLIAADLAVSIVDMTSERDSRAEFGGLSTGEYVLHMLIMSFRGAALALALAGRPAAAWALDAPWIVGSLPAFAATVAWQAFPGAVVMAALHVWLCTDSGVRTFEAIRARAEAAFNAWRGAASEPCCAVRS